MNKRFIGVLIFATVVATVGGLLTYRFLNSRQPPAKAAAPSFRIALAAKDLEVGTLLKEEDIQLGDWPGTPPLGSTNRVPDLVGRGVTTKIMAKEPIIQSRLAASGAGAGLAAMIPKGMRAVAIRTNEVVGVAGFVIPGMHVDILISGNGPGSSNALGTVTKTLLQNIEVLSAGQDFRKDAEGKPIMVAVINLLVTPEQAEQISLASSQTSIQLVLRNPLDHEVARPPGTAVGLLFNGGGRVKLPDITAPPGPARPRVASAPKPVVVAEAPPKKESPFVMEIISGLAKTETKFDSKGEGK